MGNSAYTQKYKNHWEDCQSLFIPEHFKQDKECHLSDNYTIRINEFNGKVGDYNLNGNECCLINCDGKIINKWRSIDNDGDFHKIIKHRNGKEYIIFRQDLYGYSVLDIDAGEIMQYYPESSLNGNETFIWTDIHYNTTTNVIAVSGCYWACPFNLHLFTFENPMSEQQKFVDLIECFDGGYDTYDNVDYVKWENGDLHIVRYVVETESNEPVIVKQNEYLTWLLEKGQEL